jgi:SAM-dependent methyltransferase
MMKKVKNAYHFLQKNGLKDSAMELFYRRQDNYYEKHFNVSTMNQVDDDNPHLINPEAHEYGSLHYSHLLKIFDVIPLDKKETTLIDYGCGKGRALIAAASYEYKRIIGVELSDTIATAEKNFRNMKNRLTIRVDLEKCDAQTYQIPDDTNLIYFCNPFSGSILENVTRNIENSFKRTPRKMYIIYFNNNHFDDIVRDQKWLKKYFQGEFVPYFACGLYETLP